MDKAFFVTATDTEAGKTFIAAGLARLAKAKGLSVGISKPISCGGPEDAKFYKEKLDLSESVDEINPVKFRQPLSPFAALKNEKVKIDLKKIKRSVESLRKNKDLVFVEGLGGALAPIFKDYYIADLIKSLEIPCIIISRAGLGTINHTMLTVEALRSRGLKIAGIIMNGFANSEISEGSNAEIIEELSKIKVIGRIKAKSSFSSLVEQLNNQKTLGKLIK